MKLSVIIAAYNVEEFIEECLKSVVNQKDYSCELEVVIINDGSTDATKSIIKRCIDNSQLDITLINKENGGLSDARNTGLDVSTGEFVTFLDGDDIWNHDYLNIISERLKDNVDIIEYNAYRSTRFDDYLCSKNLDIVNPQNNDVSYSEKLANIFLDTEWYSWARVYKKKLFIDIKFPKGRRFEDLATTPILYLKADKILTINRSLIGYRINTNSITMNVKESDIDDISQALISMFDWAGDNKEFQYYLLLTSLRSSVYLKYLNSVLFPHDFSKTKKIRMFIFKKITIKAVFKAYKYLPYLIFPSVLNFLSKLKKFK
ncbi:TPA: glycosyltransferase family 2 protein [Photobacterium damselae]